MLAKWEREGNCHFIATQNVDSLHQRAGSKEVAELHGNIHKIRCQSCEKEYTESSFIANESCPCGGKLRPGVVLFGEFLPEDAWQRSLKAIEAADLVIVIGTSLQVSPVNQLPSLTRGKKVYINFEIEGFTNDFDCMLQGSAKETILAIDEQLSKLK